MSNECKFCRGELKQLFTSFYCPACDDNPHALVGNNPREVIGEDFFMRNIEEDTVVYDLGDMSDEDLDAQLELIFGPDLDNNDDDKGTS